MLKIFLSSRFRTLIKPRANILDKLDAVFEGVGMENFIPDGSNSQEASIRNLKESDIVIFLISPSYGSLMDKCSLKNECKAECPMKTGKGRISYVHCEYKYAIAEEKCHLTYVFEEGFNDLDLKKEALDFKKELGKEMWKPIQGITDDALVERIRNNLATKIVEWHTEDKLNFKQFCDREEVLNKIIDNIDSKVEVWGVGGVGKTALIQVALLVQKLKGRKILTIGTTKTYTSGSGLEYFSNKRADDQFITGSRDKITIYDVINAFAENGLLLNAEEVDKLPKDKQIEVLSQKIRSEKDLILFIDDFHLATEDVVNMAKSVDHLILSSRKNTHIARKEFYLGGIDEEDRENLIKLFSTEIPEKVRRFISKIAEGHPVSTELLVMNYEYIDFDKIKDFDLTDLTDDNQVKEFYNRVIEEIFSTNLQALTLLKDLAVLNTDLPTNVNKESVLIAYRTENIRRIFNSLVDTGMLKKRGGKEGTYEFYFRHIQDVLEDSAVQENHKKAIEYYIKKRDISGEHIDDAVEVLFHKVRSNPSEKLVGEFIKKKRRIQPIHYGFKRLINIGEELKISLNNNDKADILFELGDLYYDSRRFEDAEHTLLNALDIYISSAKLNPDEYLSKVATTQKLLGNTYSELKRFEKAEDRFLKSLEIWNNLVERNPKKFKFDLSGTQNDFGLLNLELNKFKEAENLFLKSLKIRIELAETNPDKYMEYLATIQHNLGMLYNKINRFGEAEKAHIEALNIYKGLWEKNPDKYLPIVWVIQNDLGIFYTDTNEFKDAETAFLESIKVSENFAEKIPEVYLPNLALTQINLGRLYLKKNQLIDARIVLLKALKIYNDLMEKNPIKYLSNVAKLKILLGDIYRNLKQFKEAEIACLESLKIFRGIAENNPEIYLPDIASSQILLGSIYIESKRFKDAENACFEALRITKNLFKKDPNIYLPNIAFSQINLGILCLNLNRFQESENLLLSALDISSSLAEKYPKIYEHFVMLSKMNLGNVYLGLKKFEDAKTFTLEASEICKKSVRIHPDVYLPFLLKTQITLTTIYLFLKKYREAEKSCLEGLEIGNELMKKDPIVHLPDVALVHMNLGRICLQLKNYKQAEDMYLKSLNDYKSLVHENPEVYSYNLGLILIDIGVLYVKLKRYPEAETVSLEALEIINSLAEKNPEAYLPIKIPILRNLGLINLKMGRLKEGINFRKAAKQLQKQLGRPLMLKF